MKGSWIHVCVVITENHQDFILISICTQGGGGGYSRFQVTGMTKGFWGDRTILDGMMKKQTQAINFYFFISFNAFWTFLRFRNSSWDFFGINFLPGIFLQVLVEALGILFGFYFCPHLIIPVTWNPIWYMDWYMALNTKACLVWKSILFSSNQRNKIFG